MSKPRSKLVVKQASDGRWYVQLRAANGRVLYQSERQPQKSAAMTLREAFMGAARDPEYRIEDFD